MNAQVRESRLDTLRKPPHSESAEQAVLGSLMMDPTCWAKIGDWLTESDFYLHQHRLIFRSIADNLHAGKPVDHVTLGEWFEAHCLADQLPRGAATLHDLVRNTPTAASIVAHGEIVQEHSRLRQLIEVGTEAVNAGFTPNGCESALLVSNIQRKLSALNATSQHAGPQPPKPALHRWFQALSDRYERGDRITGIESPWPDVDVLTAGWQPGELIIIAARPNIGKSVLGFNQLAFSGLNKIRGLGFSLEMGYEQVLQRMVAALGEIPHSWLASPAGQDRDYFPNLNACIRDLSAANFLVDDQPRLTAEMIVARAKREHMRNPLSLVVVDHLHDMRRPGKDLVNEIADDCRVLKALAKELKVPVLVLAQLNRNGDGRPTLKDLRASGGIEEVADLVLMMHREDYQKFDGRDPSPVELIVAKGRNIPSGRTVYLRNRYDIQRLDPMPGYSPPTPEPPPRRGFDAKARAACS